MAATTLPSLSTWITTKEEYKDVEGAGVFNQAMNIIFQHQPSGFSKEDGDSPSVINQLLTKGMSTVNDAP